MDVIEIKTLVDITNTKVNRLGQGSQLELNQQRNFITLLQCIEIRSIISYDLSPSFETIDLKTFSFGSVYKGRNTVWTFRIKPDRESVYMANDGDPVGLLIEDVHEVPIIKNLSETVNIDKSIFDCRDLKFKNTIIRAIPGTI